MNRGENELLAECYRNEQRTRRKVIKLAGYVAFFIVCFAVGYSIK